MNLDPKDPKDPKFIANPENSFEKEAKIDGKIRKTLLTPTGQNGWNGLEWIPQYSLKILD